MDGIEDVFVINLKECTERLAAISQNLKEFEIRYTVWDAIKGKDLSNSELAKYTSSVCNTFLCNHGMIGCHLTHILLWNTIAKKYGNDKHKWFIILEDDAYLRKGFVDNVNNIIADLRNWEQITNSHFPDFIHLACHVFCREHKVTPQIFTSHIINTTRGYMISARGARILSELFTKVYYHVDMMLTINQIINNSLAYYTTHSFIDSRDDHVSSIGGKTFPRVLPDILNKIIPETTAFHILYETPFMSFRKIIDINVLVVVFVLIVAVLAAKKYYIIAGVYVLFEILYFILALKQRKKRSC